MNKEQAPTFEAQPTPVTAPQVVRPVVVTPAPEVRTVTPAETGHANEATHASNNWLEKAGKKLDRWLGHGVRTLVGETAIYWGTYLTTFKSVIWHSGSAVQEAMLSALSITAGTTLALGGAVAEWKIGMRHAKSGIEKHVFWLSKVGQIVAPLTLSNPEIVAGFYLAGAAMALRGMTHRK